MPAAAGRAALSARLLSRVRLAAVARPDAGELEAVVAQQLSQVVASAVDRIRPPRVWRLLLSRVTDRPQQEHTSAHWRTCRAPNPQVLAASAAAPSAAGTARQRALADAAAQAAPVAGALVGLYSQLEGEQPRGAEGLCQITPRDLSAIVWGLAR